VESILKLLHGWLYRPCEVSWETDALSRCLKQFNHPR
jgi:hypothetical protein